MTRPRRGKVLLKDKPAGIVEETKAGFRFTYEPAFLGSGQPVSVTLPLQPEPFESERLFSFFEGLLPEGWYKAIVCRTLKIDEEDSFGLLIKACGDCVGAVSIEELTT